MRFNDSSAHPDRLPAYHCVLSYLDTHVERQFIQVTMTLRLEALTSCRALPSPCMHLQRLTPSKCSLRHRSSIASAQTRCSAPDQHISRCHLGTSIRETQREHSSMSATSVDSNRQQSTPEHRSINLGTIIKNAAKATAIAALILAAVWCTKSNLLSRSPVCPTVRTAAV